MEINGNQHISRRSPASVEVHEARIHHALPLPGPIFAGALVALVGQIFAVAHGGHEVQVQRDDHARAEHPQGAQHLAAVAELEDVVLVGVDAEGRTRLDSAHMYAITFVKEVDL